VYTWLGLGSVELPVSPKSHDREVMLPVDASAKLTPRGAKPLVGVPVKLATGGGSTTSM
jgi:hypothetical protein